MAKFIKVQPADPKMPPELFVNSEKINMFIEGKDKEGKTVTLIYMDDIKDRQYMTVYDSVDDIFYRLNRGNG